ncbi:MAG TPA: MFS transporter [Chloroflexota bacterium]|nr:MFS transporter [Chloroflexota bacterium]
MDASTSTRLPGPSWLAADGRRVLLARACRSFGYGIVSVVLGVHVADLGMGGVELGILLAAAFLGSSILTIVVALTADRFGRKRVLLIFSALMTLTGAAYALSDQFWLLLLVSLSGTISAGIQEIGPFVTLEQAVLSQMAPDNRRTRIFTMYNLVGIGAGSAGALFAGGIASLVSQLGLNPLLGHRWLFGAYAVGAFAALVIAVGLSSAVELGAPPALASALGIHRSRGIVFRLTALFGWDSFGGGFIVQSIVAYWFTLRFGLGVDGLGPVFAASNLLAALSVLVAERLAGRIGLINTMVWSHVPANALVMLQAFVPSVELAIGLQLIRSFLSQMDVPTRQSYLMAVVDPSERTAAAGFTTVGRNVAQAIAPPLAGIALQSPFLGLTLVVGGAIKIGYDLALWYMFRTIRPPEEATRGQRPEARGQGREVRGQGSGVRGQD